MAGYLGGSCYSTPISGSYWEVNRGLPSRDYRRWPAATQGLLHRLWTGVAGSADADRGLRLAALCLLMRLEVSQGSRLQSQGETSYFSVCGLAGVLGVSPSCQWLKLPPRQQPRATSKAY